MFNDEFKIYLNYLQTILTSGEAQVYLYLVQNPGCTVYQISKGIDISRSSVYPIVESMYNRGMLLKISTEKDEYMALEPETLLKKLKYEYNKKIDDATEVLQNIKANQPTNYFMNISGYESNIEKAKEILRNSNREVYMNIDFSLEVFDKEFMELENKGVRVIIFSFLELECKYKNVEIYSHGFMSSTPSRILLVSDLSIVLVSGSISDTNNWIGTVSNNKLLVTLISEHIHHDIYLYQIKRKSTVDFFSDKDNSVLLNTLNENHGLKTREYKKEYND